MPLNTQGLPRRSLLALAASPLLLTGSANAQTDAELDKIRKILEGGSKRFYAVIEDVNEQQWNARVSTIRHTVGQEAEHLALSENDIQYKVREAGQRPPMPEVAKKLAGKEEMVHDFLLGEGKSAENFAAKGKLINKDEVLEYYGAANRKLMKLLDDSPDLSLHVSEHPVPEIGALTGLEWFYYIAYHRERHVRQIEAIKSHEEYPGRKRSAD